MYRISDLKNGLRVATSEMPHMASVSVGLWIGVGSRYEPAELNGVCHFIEHLVFKGTRRRSASQISEAVEGIGGYLNAFTSEEATCFHARATHERFEELLDVLMDMLLEPKFAPVEIDKEREVIKEEIAMYLDEPQHQVQELLNSTLWPNQPLGRPITGTDKTLTGMDRDSVLGYLRKNYVAGSVLAVVTGNVTHRQACKSVARYALRFNIGATPACAPAVNRQLEPVVRAVTKKT